ncbi:target of Nesh-SH3-like isoform X1 [Oncorhynchus kisutch]|uniref:Target of Nesh-SH3-like n=1 Tax=Oncorhynchus kisutch TaxID=8019 RepID=A0A8C7ICG0_ONCKI|nr:target of Nesh-SH3-like isoform X1 [Oncorhynchus kisutch]
MQLSHTFLVFLFLLFIVGIALAGSSTARRSRVRRQNMKVRINATGDTIVMKFVRPNADTKLEGYILGYGSSMFSKQFIQLPENGLPYETEIDAEPKYLIAVQPIPVNDVKKQCTGNVNLEKPLHLVIGSVTPTSVLLSWGTLLKTPYEGNVMNDCLEDGNYTVRYRERNRKWTYQTCPASDTVIDSLKPNTAYEFGVRPNNKERSGVWSKPVIHNTNMSGKAMQKPYKPRTPLKPVKTVNMPRAFFPPRHAVHNRSQGRTLFRTPVAPRTTFAPTSANRQHFVSTPRPTMPQVQHEPTGRADQIISASSPSVDVPRASPAFPLHSPNLSLLSPQLLPSPNLPLTSPADPVLNPNRNGQRHRGPAQARPQQAQPQQPAKVTQNLQTPTGTSFRRPLTPTEPRSPTRSVVVTAARNTTLPRSRVSLYSTPNGIRPLSLPRDTNTNSSLTSDTPGADWEHNKGLALPKPAVWSRKRLGSPAVLQPFLPVNKRPNLVGKSGDKDKLMDLKQGDKASILRSFPLITAKPTKQKTTTLTPALNATGDNSSVFSSLPTSEVDAMGKKRFVAPHVIYKTDKKPDEPCSITKSLSFFPEEEGVEQNVTAPPRLPPSNLTVVTVEGCPSFVILDWEKTDNDTTEYEVISRTHGPNGEEVSILTTNQTHTAVENLKPENSYEFKVKPKNELGEGPASEPVLFNTESADPRVSENVSGKDAIWTQFPFKADSYSECNGKQYVKRTWYRKFVGIQLCNSLRYKIYMSDSLTGKFYNIGDQTGHGEDHCQFVDSFLDGQTGSQLLADQLPSRSGFYRAMRQEPVNFGEIGGNSHATYVGWYECGTPIPGKW